MQQYTVEEPKTPAIERGFEVPRGGDEELLEMIEEWQDATPEAVSESFNQYGEDLLESFFERHDNDFGDTHGQRFREYLNMLASFGTNFADLDPAHASGVAKQLSHLLLTQVVPAVKTTLRAGRRQKQARGGRDSIPGRATAARDERAQVERQQIKERIESEVRMMTEFDHLQELLNVQLHKGLQVQDEVSLYSAQRDVIKRKMFLWKGENERHQGAFNNVLTQLQTQYTKTSKALDQAISQLHGVGFAQASKEAPRKDPRSAKPGAGAPWRKQGAPSASRAASSARMREAALTRARSQGRPLSPITEQAQWADETRRRRAEAQAALDREEETFRQGPGGRAIVAAMDHAARAGPPDIRKIAAAAKTMIKLEQEGKRAPPAVVKLADRMQEVKDWLDATGYEARAVPSRSPSGPLRMRGGGFGSSSSAEPPSSSESEFDEDLFGDFEDEAPKKRSLSREIEDITEDLDDFYPEGQEKTTVRDFVERFNEDVPSIQDEHGTQIGYVLPYSGDPINYVIAYGVQASDVVDLFRTYHRQIDYRYTVKSILRVMHNADPEFRLDKVLPKHALDAKKIEWEGRTLRKILIKATQPKAGRKPNLDRLTKKQAFTLIRGGRPTESGTAEKIRPGGTLVKMFQSWRNGPAARSAGLRSTDALQLFSYHRGHKTVGGAGPGSPSVSRGPSAFRGNIRASNASRDALRALSNLFGKGGAPQAGMNPFSPSFWRMEPEDQIAWMKGKSKYKGYNPKEWFEVLQKFGKTPKKAPYDDGEKLNLWTQVSAIFRGFMEDAHVKTENLGNYIGHYAAAYAEPRSRSRTPPPEVPDRGARKKKQRIPTAEDALAANRGKLKIRNFPKWGTFPGGDPGQHLMNVWSDRVDETGASAQGALNKSDTLERELRSELKRYAQRRQERKAGPSMYEPWNVLRGTATNKDWDSFYIYLEKAAWNEYIRDLGPFLDAKRQDYMFPLMPGGGTQKFLFEEVFRQQDYDVVSQLLQKFVAASLWNTNTKRGLSYPGDAKINLRTNWDEEYKKLESQYQHLENQYKKAGKLLLFPVQDWKNRLWLGNQFHVLTEIYGEISAGKERMHDVYRAPERLDARAQRAQRRRSPRSASPPPPQMPVHTPLRSARKRKMMKPRVPAKPKPTPLFLDPAPKRVKREVIPEEKSDEPNLAQVHARQVRAEAALAELMRLDPGNVDRETYVITEDLPGAGLLRLEDIEADIKVTREEQAEEQEALEAPIEIPPPRVRPREGGSEADKARRRAWRRRGPGRGLAEGLYHQAAAGPAAARVLHMRPPIVRPAIMMGADPLMDAGGAVEQVIEQYYAQAYLPVRKHDNRLRAEVVAVQNYEALNAVHLLQTDGGFSQPVMGRVHIVQPASNYSDKHFMHDVEGDINEGQKVLVERSRRGPFKQQRGRSTVMDRSAHVTYRKRAGAFEITARRGITQSEMQQLLSKLGIHRMSVYGSHLVIIKGGKRYRLGPLAEINLKYLTELVEECIDQYGSCGLEITESRAGSGALYNPGPHSARFKSNSRKGRGIA